MGTPHFAVPSLQILLEAGYVIPCVITAPDTLGGRGMKQSIISPVKSFALEKGLEILQPRNLKSGVFLNALQSFHADLQVVVAFRMLPEVVWKMPRLGTINLHGSLLPAYRGAAPIQWAIIDGQRETGLTTFMLRQAIDTGDIIEQRPIPILDEDNASTLHDRMAIAGAGLILGSVDLLNSGEVNFRPQNEDFSSHAPKIQHSDARINWVVRPVEINNLIRGMSPFPGAWTVLDGSELKIIKARVHSERQDKHPGQLSLQDKKLVVQANGGELELMEVQMAGKRRMNTGDFLRGYSIRDWSVT